MTSFKLFYTPTSCGAASYITATYAGLEFDSEIVDLGTKKTASGTDFLKVNSKGNVPCILLPCGAVLNENIATLTYIADKNPSAGLAPAAGTTERYKYLNAISFVASELHRAFGALFYADEETKPALIEKALAASFKYTDHFLKDNPFVLGESVCAADFYAYIVFTWAGYHGVDLAKNKIASDFVARVKALPAVVDAHSKMNAAASA
eukprot:GFKZ01006532.1.p1 GENE.GFKZ01006532.1~~GFKZ01006532.1.p1  ORF type:complete len:207 (+),score=27.39 GFKZ01006532.1:341-961(+)